MAGRGAGVLTAGPEVRGGWMTAGPVEVGKGLEYGWLDGLLLGAGSERELEPLDWPKMVVPPAGARGSCGR